MSKTIKVVIDQDGSVEIEAIGYKGPECEKATQALEEAIGDVVSRKKKPEYNARVASQSVVRS